MAQPIAAPWKMNEPSLWEHCWTFGKTATFKKWGAPLHSFCKPHSAKLAAIGNLAKHNYVKAIPLLPFKFT
jgi:hypothetical protein